MKYMFLVEVFQKSQVCKGKRNLNRVFKESNESNPTQEFMLECILYVCVFAFPNCQMFSLYNYFVFFYFDV